MNRKKFQRKANKKIFNKKKSRRRGEEAFVGTDFIK